MRLTSSEIEITKEDPFKNDKLEREVYVKILTEIIETSKSSFVLAINSSYGTGKTTFLRMWKSFLESKNTACLIYNAWENDYSDSPILTLVAELEKQIKSKKLFITEESEKIFETAKSFGKSLIKKSIPLSIRLLTGGLLNLKDEDVEKTISEIFEKTAEDGIDNYINEQDDIESFKIQLSKFVESLNKDGHSKLIIFIDELDRCKPSFAVKLLEEIKHIFDVKNIYFVLAVDSIQLSNSLKSIYGNDLDVKGYLKRFIDLEYDLPSAQVDKFLQLIAEELELDKIFEARANTSFQNDKKYFLNSAILFHYRFSLTLRDLEHIFRKILIVLKSSNPGENVYPHLLLFLLVLKEKNETYFEQFVNQKIEVVKLLTFLDQGINKKEIDRKYIFNLNIIKAHIIWYLNPNYLDTFYDENGNIKDDLHEDRKDEITELKDLLGYVNKDMRSIHGKKSIIQQLTKKVNMLLPLKKA